MIPLLSGYPLTGRYGYRRRPATHRDLQRIATFCRVGGHARCTTPCAVGTHSFPEGAIALPEFPGSQSSRSSWVFLHSTIANRGLYESQLNATTVTTSDQEEPGVECFQWPHGKPTDGQPEPFRRMLRHNYRGILQIHY
jgi:hypothetical protein